MQIWVDVDTKIWKYLIAKIPPWMQTHHVLTIFGDFYFITWTCAFWVYEVYIFTFPHENINGEGSYAGGEFIIWYLHCETVLWISSKASSVN